MIPTKILGHFELLLPPHLAEWDVWAYWEKARLESMEATLTIGDLLIDVGAEQGWMSALCASFVGGSNMALAEPEPNAWGCIREIWQANGIEPPRASWAGLLAGPNRGPSPYYPPDLDFDPKIRDGWPGCAWDADPCGARAYRYLHEDKHVGSTPRSTLDAWCKDADLQPAALTIDVEGAEAEVLRGAAGVLFRYRPVVWVSLHPDLMERDYGTTPAFVHGYMESFGYKGTHLATDHEEHWLYR